MDPKNDKKLLKFTTHINEIDENNRFVVEQVISQKRRQASVKKIKKWKKVVKNMKKTCFSRTCSKTEPTFWDPLDYSNNEFSF